ncbi:hypothetical protein KKZ51_14935, partial [Enterobacter roggenkampii]|nr:hypothetical protein [Enterobacter roggenkampii]MBT2033177.1 hypothetical protein [Enterobacter roggenkampii]
MDIILPGNKSQARVWAETMINLEARKLVNTANRGQFGYRKLLYYKGFPGMSTPVFTVSVCTIVK